MDSTRVFVSCSFIAKKKVFKRVNFVDQKQVNLFIFLYSNLLFIDY